METLDLFTSPEAPAILQGMELRPYQQDAIQAIIRDWNQFDRLLSILPTGSGKTILFSKIAEACLPKKTLILAHQNELIEQAVDKLFHATGLIADIEKAESRASLTSDIIVASIQSMERRLDKFPSNHFGQVICDESHLAMSNSWQKVLMHFSAAKILGVTATPDRSDGKSLMQFFQKLSYEIKLFDLIKQGYLAKISVRTVPIEIDITGVGQKSGDYDAEGLDNTLTPYFQKVCEAILEFARNRKTLVFLPLIKTSQKFVHICKQNGILAEHIDGTSDERKTLLQEFKDDRFQVLANSSLLTTGYDEPSIECIINLRPTRSRTLYSQMIGRGTRIKPEGRESDLLILDFLWQFEKHVIMSPGHLIARDEEQARRITKKYAKLQEIADLEFIDSEAAKERELDLLNALKNQKRKGEYFDALAFAAMTADRDLMEYAAMTGEEGQAPTKKQIEELSRLGFLSDAVVSKGQAQILIDKALARRTHNLCSPKQLFFLKKHNIPNAENITRTEASEILTRMWGKKWNAAPNARTISTTSWKP